MSLQPTSAHVRELILREARFASEPIPALLKSGRLLPLETFPAQLPPAQKPVVVPFDTKMHRLVLRNAIRLLRLASIRRSSRSARLSLGEWSGNRRLKNRVFREKAFLNLQEVRC